MDAKLKRKLDKVFSEYIRLRDSHDGFFVCISCGRTLPYEQADCGHYINRSHLSTRWDETNCNAQCRHCNRFDEGNAVGYRAGIIRKYGERALVLLEARKYAKTKISDFEISVMISEYRRLVNGIRDSKSAPKAQSIKKEGC